MLPFLSSLCRSEETASRFLFLDCADITVGCKSFLMKIGRGEEGGEPGLGGDARLPTLSSLAASFFNSPIDKVVVPDARADESGEARGLRYVWEVLWPLLFRIESDAKGFAANIEKLLAGLSTFSFCTDGLIVALSDLVLSALTCLLFDLDSSVAAGWLAGGLLTEDDEESDSSSVI